MKNKGFTLIELLVVVAIIGVLATIVLSSLGDARNRAKDASIISALSQMRTQAELQFLDTGNYNTVCDVGTKGWELYHDAARKASGGSTLYICYDEDGLTLVNVSDIDTPTSSNTPSGPDPSSGNRWAASLPLSTGSWFCVDSSGAAKDVGATRGIGSVGPDKTC